MITDLIAIEMYLADELPYREIESLRPNLIESAILSRAARAQESTILCWLDPFSDIVIPPQRLADAVVEVTRAISGETAREYREAHRMLVGFLERAAIAGAHVRVIEVP